MGKISNTTLYPVATSLANNDLFIFTVNATGATKTVRVSTLISAISGGTIFTDTLVDASTYQNDLLIGASETDYLCVFGGSDLRTQGLITTLDSITGTITFDSDFTPYSGTITVIYTL